MSDLALGLLSLPALLALVLLRVPIGLAMLGVGAAGLALAAGGWSLPLARLRTETVSTFGSYALSIIPMFLLMGQFAARGGLSRALFRAAEGLVGHRRGGVPMAAVGACAGFGAICGSSLATAATMGRVALPELRRTGTDGGFAAATLAAGGTLGILVPPSVVLVIYAVLTEQNVSALFAAALLPAILAAALYAAAIALYARRHPARAGTSARTPWPERLRRLRAVWPVLAIFGVVVGGIWGGAFTPTEGAAVGAAATGLAAWAAGGLGRAGLAETILETAQATGMIFLIVLGAGLYNGFLALTGVPAALAAWVEGPDPFVVILAILLVYLVLGCVMDSLSMILLTVPIFWPVLRGLEIEFVTLAELHAVRAAPVLAEIDAALAAGLAPPAALAEDVLAGIRLALAEGAALSPEEVRALGLRRASEGALAAINETRLAIWFGILVLCVVETGLITPPVGLNLFVIHAMDRSTPIGAIWRAVLWFVAADLVRLALLLMVPGLALWLVPI